MLTGQPDNFFLGDRGVEIFVMLLLDILGGGIATLEYTTLFLIGGGLHRTPYSVLMHTSSVVVSPSSFL